MAPAANRKPALSRRETALRALLYPRRFLVDAEFEPSIREGLNQQGVAKLVLNRALPTHFARCSAENSSGHGETRAIESAGPSIASGEHRSARPGGAGDDGRDGLATPRGLQMESCLRSSGSHSSLRGSRHSPGEGITAAPARLAGDQRPGAVGSKETR